MRKLTILMLSAVLAIALLAGCGSDKKETAVPAAGDPAAEAAQYKARINKCKKQIEDVTDFKPDVVLVFGSGVDDYVNQLDPVAEIKYSDIEGWPTTSAPGNGDRLIFAEKAGLKLAVMHGRPHYFEGYTGAEVVLPLRVLHLLGAKTVIFVSTVGALNPDYRVGDFVSVRDHISSFIPSPLIGENDEDFGDRYIDMTTTYDKAMQDVMLGTCKDHDIPVHSGVFLQVIGPQYETPSEVKLYRQLGADTISMNDVAEAIAATHMGMKVCAVNYVSNMGAGMIEQEVDHDDMMEETKDSGESMQIIIDALLEHLASL